MFSWQVEMHIRRILAGLHPLIWDWCLLETTLAVFPKIGNAKLKAWGKGLLRQHLRMSNWWEQVIQM
jgi:hypothetical protein